MSEKMIVTFDEIPVLPCEVDYLAYCKHCHTYNLGHKPCLDCGREKFITLDQIVGRKVQKHFILGLVGMVTCVLVMCFIRSSMKQLMIAILWMSGCIACYILIYKNYKEVLMDRELGKYIHENWKDIQEDLRRQKDKAAKDIEEERLLPAYERLRYIAKLMDCEEVRIFKLICLKNFSLRSEMPLEMNTLLQRDGNSFLIDYIYEVSKIRKDLIDEETLLYIIEYKEQVLMKLKGKRIMGSVLEASLRSKYLLRKYAKYMPGYLKYFTRERLVRFCKLSSCIEDEVLREALLAEASKVLGSNTAFKASRKEET